MSRSQFAPIALFAYRRVEHLVRALDALSACPEFLDSRVFVFSDGPKDEASNADVTRVRAALRARLTPNMTIVEAPAHCGLAGSITAGATRLCDEFGRAIVLEDDLIVSPSVLTWFNVALQRYADDARVWQIAGHQFDVPEFSSRDEGMFLHLTTSWGWATWKRAWDQYDPMAKGWERLKFDNALRRKFDFDGSYPYSEMLIDQMAGRIDSWAIRWRWAAFRANAISLFPPRPLASNIGFDATATHARFRLLKKLVQRWDTGSSMNSELCPCLPAEVGVAAGDDAAVANALFLSRRLSTRLFMPSPSFMRRAPAPFSGEDGARGGRRSRSSRGATMQSQTPAMIRVQQDVSDET
jgi:hypothetical protein